MNKKGFTLIELLVVIALLGILVGFVTVNVLKVYDRQQGKISKQEQKVIKEGVEHILSIIDDCDYDLDKDLLVSLGYESCDEIKTDLNTGGLLLTISDLKSSGYLSGANLSNYIGYVDIKRTNNNYDIDVNNVVSKDFIKNLKVAKLDIDKFKTKITDDINEIIFNFDRASSGDDVSTSDSEEKIYAHVSGTRLYISSVGRIKCNTNSYMFNGKNKLKSILLVNFDTSNVTNMERMFLNCENLKKLDISNFDTSKVMSMSFMFSGCKNLKELDLSSFYISRIIDLKGMFNNTSLKTIYISNDDSFKVVWAHPTNTNYNNMFYGCNNLVGGAGTEFADTNVTNGTYAHIDGGPSNPGYFTAK